jgi:hypothetical protein
MVPHARVTGFARIGRAVPVAVDHPTHMGVAVFPSPEIYGTIRRQHPDVVLLFRRGGTIAVAEEQAPAVAEALGLGRLAASTPFVELPAVDTDRLVLDLLLDGHRVAICEPVGAPGEREVRDGPAAFHAPPATRGDTADSAMRQLPLF